MLLVTTLDYFQLGSFIRDKKVSLDNASLIFGEDYDVIHRYLTEHLGSRGYVMGIRGRINEASVALLAELDQGLSGQRVILEVDVDDDDLIRFDAAALDDATEMMVNGLPDGLVYNQLDHAMSEEDIKDGLEVLCTSTIKNSGNIRVTSLGGDINFASEGITFVKLGGESATS